MSTDPTHPTQPAHQARLPPQRGVTLLELMAVLAVVAVLAALALPSMGALAQRHRLIGAAEALSADLAEARFEAARRGQTLHLQADAGPGWCWTIAAAPACGCDQAPAGCQIKAVHASDHAGVRLLDPLRARLEPDGASGATAATFESARGDRLRVELSPMGRPRICVPSGPTTAGASRYPQC